MLFRPIHLGEVMGSGKASLEGKTSSRAKGQVWKDRNGLPGWQKEAIVSTLCLEIESFLFQPPEAKSPAAKDILAKLGKRLPALVQRTYTYFWL